MKSSPKTFEKQLKGDGLRVNMDINDLNLKVSGDGCRVTVERNCGSIRMIGDGCSLKVNCNDGEIEYKGDGGVIYLGGGSRTKSVNYVGDGGRISVRNDNTINKEEDDDDELGKIRRRRNKLKKSGINKMEEDNKLKKSSSCSVSDSELEVNMDNVLNENKESMRKKKINNNNNNNTEYEKIIKDQNLRRTKTAVVVTKISAEQIPININNNNFIKNWFRSPPSIIRNFKSGPESL